MSDIRPIFTLPLFPLHHVLFPELPLQLHVFEERYRIMINECIEENRPFGVALILEGEEIGEHATPHGTGCLARIIKAEHQEDGRIYLLAIGEQRFRLLDYVKSEAPYMLGRVELLQESVSDEDEEAAQEQIPALKNLFLEYLTRMAARTNRDLPEIEMPDRLDQLSYFIAAIAEFAPTVKQVLLETDSVIRRLELETALLKDQLKVWENEEPTLDDTQKLVIIREMDPEHPHWQRYLSEGRN